MRFHVRERGDLHNSNSRPPTNSRLPSFTPIARDDLFVMVNVVKNTKRVFGTKTQFPSRTQCSRLFKRFAVSSSRCGHMGKLLPDRRNQTVTFNLDPVQMFVYLRRI